MTQQELDLIVNAQIVHIKSVLSAKANEYATGDRLYNFKMGSELTGKIDTPTKICWGYMLKHLVSVHDIANGVRKVTLEQLDEKIGDSINYLILLKALIIEQMNQSV